MSAAERVGTFPHDSEAWHAARAAGIGASEIAVILGLSPWESHWALWHRKAGLLGPQSGNELTEWGHYLEPAIARRFADQRPDWRVRRTGTWRSRMRPWQVANPDRLAYVRLGVGRGAVVRVPVEVKWAPHADEFGGGPEDIPVKYRCQLLWQMDVLGAPYGYLAALVGSEYREYRIDYDPEDVAVMREAGQAFMASLAAGVPPALDDTSHTYRALKELHPDIDDSFDVEIPARLAGEYRGRLDALTAAEAGAKRVKNELLAAMGTAKYAVFEGERIVRRQPHGRGGIALYPVKPTKDPKSIREAIAS